MNPKLLIVYVPGINLKTNSWGTLISKLKDEPSFKMSTWRGWNHNCGYFSLKSALSVAKDLRDYIDAEWNGGSYDEIILMGHSMGGTILRQAYLLATGIYKNEQSSRWSGHVSKIILLAALNRGVNLKLIRVRLYDLAMRVLSKLMLGKRMLAQDLIFGSEFITDLRLQWINYMRQLPDNERPMLVQILGKRDGIVSRDDSIDLEQFPDAYHFPIPDVAHGELPDLNQGKNREMRYKVIRDVLLGHNLDRAEERIEGKAKKNVVFILHGIRAANRGWVQELGDLIEHKLQETEVVQPSYGYLSALEFALPFLHRRPIRIFQSKYSDYFATNPNAQFHFIGHSNGTYIFGQALLALSGMHFNRVILIGSVLPRNYPWREIFKREQIKLLRNDQANKDVPVGILCSGLKGLGREDVGTGGYEGFSDDDSKVIQYSFFEGGHSIALDSNNLPNIANFLAFGIGAPKPVGLVKERYWFGLLSRLAPWLFRLLVLGCILIATLAVIQQSWLLAIVLVSSLLLVAFLLKIV